MTVNSSQKVPRCVSGFLMFLSPDIFRWSLNQIQLKILALEYIIAVAIVAVRAVQLVFLKHN